MIVLRSFQLVKASEFRIRCTMQVCIVVSGKTAPIASGKPFRPSTTAIRMSFTPRGLQLVHHLQPEFGAFALFDPKSENMFFAVDIESERDIDSLVADQAVVADLDLQRVETDDGKNRIERPVLPLPDYLQHRVRNPADQVGRDPDAVQVLQMALDLPHRHATRVERENPIVPRDRPEAGPRTGYTVEPGLALRHQLRLEAPLAVPRNLDLEGAVVRLQRLLGVAVADVPHSAAGRIALLISQVHRQLGTERSFNQRLLQTLQQPVVAQQVPRRLVAGQQLVQNLVADIHLRGLLSLHGVTHGPYS